MTKIKIKKLKPNAVVPTYAHGPAEDAGMDLYACETVWIPVGVPVMVKTGIAVELPPGYEGQIRPRSGMAFHRGITVLNSPGTIDPSYRGEIGVILFRPGGHSPTADTFSDMEINAGDKIAQLVVARYEAVEFGLTGEELTESERGPGGFGSTGL